MKKYNRKYILEYPYSEASHTWVIETAKGAVHLHIRAYKHDNVLRYSSGLETHWRTPPEYMKQYPPSHKDCWILKCPCWHDGTSLYAEEKFLPMVQTHLDKGELSEYLHNTVFNRMESYADDVFYGERDV